ncbi:putative glycosyltransferase [Kineosphaera limosa NBRC 100340]|uniref:D-inositol 3-phosphate glycosyltransferase n=1 Tax=Kineosphaera limosa NBRC 100340 TaxID=1184609 RepID=K6WU55_9MICO|nr:putative glycosyltransferase [Kineosphaera limosa NBRC 100340]
MCQGWPVKIALVTDCYLPRLGGIEVQVRDLAQGLRSVGHEVEVFTATTGEDGQHGGLVEIVDDIPVHRLGLPLPAGFPLNPFAGRELRRRLRDGFDVAHVHMGVVSPFTVEATRVARSLGLPTTMTWHCMLAWAEPAIGLTGAVRRWARAGVSMNAVSSVAAVPVQRLLGNLADVRVLPNGIDVDTWWQPAHGSTPPPTSPHVELVTAMRLVARKRPIPMLQVLQRVHAMVPEVPFRLTILGDGRLRSSVEAYVRREGIADWVDLPGRVSRPELLRRYAAAHVYLSPAKLESFGIAALEARCAGLPVVGLDTSGASEFVYDGVNGYLARTDDGMASAIARLLTDTALRERMYRYNVTVPPSDLDWSAVIATTEREYERAMGRLSAPERVR